MNTELKNAVMATDRDAQYDNSAKRLIAHKIILARILVKTVEEFKGMDPLEVAALIEGLPYISAVPVEPGLTNAVHFQNGQRLVGFNTENQELNEGLVRFDIVFYVRMKDGLSQIIINVEAQKDEPSDYEILNRAVFYVSRLVSSQKERDFENSSYDDIKCVYSIWICMNMEENTMSHIHRLLGALLSRELTIDEKLDIIGNEYDIPLEENFRKDMSTMCNLSQGVKEEGIAIGRREGLEEGRREGHAELITKMYKNGLSIEQIASATDKTVEEVRAIIEGKEKSQEA